MINENENEAENENMSRRYDINRPKLRHGHKYTKCKWDKVFKSGPREICGKQPSKNFTWSTLEYFAPNVSQYNDGLCIKQHLRNI